MNSGSAGQNRTSSSRRTKSAPRGSPWTVHCWAWGQLSAWRIHLGDSPGGVGEPTWIRAITHSPYFTLDIALHHCSAGYTTSLPITLRDTAPSPDSEGEVAFFLVWWKVPLYLPAILRMLLPQTAHLKESLCLIAQLKMLISPLFGWRPCCPLLNCWVCRSGHLAWLSLSLWPPCLAEFVTLVVLIGWGWRSGRFVFLRMVLWPPCLVKDVALATMLCCPPCFALGP